MRAPPSGKVRLKVEMLCNTRTTGSIHSYGMYLVEERDRAVLLGEVADLLNVTDGTAHGVDTLKCDDLGRLLGVLGELLFKVCHVVVFEDNLACLRVADTLDHRRVVHTVGEDDATGHLAAERRECRIVGDVARAENERRGLAVERSEFLLESKMHLTVTSNVAGPTGTRAVFVERAVHRLEHDWVLGHAQVVVGAPHIDLVALGARVCDRELGSEAVDVVKVAIGLVLAFLVKLTDEESLVVEGCCSVLGVRLGSMWVGRSFCMGGAASSRLSCSDRRSGLGSSSSGRRMRAYKARIDRVNAFLFVDFVDLRFAGNRGISAMGGSELGGAQDKRRTHDRALGGLFSQTGDCGVAER